MREEQQEAEDHMARLLGAWTEAGSRVAALRARLEEVQAQAAEHQAERDRTADALSRLLSRREALEEARTRALAADNALEEVLRKHRGRRLVDLLQVPEDLEQAVEAAVGDRLWSVVVDNRAQALQALQELWAAGGGRVSFLPLDSLPARRAPDRSLTGQAGVLGRLSELVGCPARYRPAVEALLRNTWLVEDLEVAFRLRGLSPAGARCWSLRGW
jgi:chromosome segregation protein